MTDWLEAYYQKLEKKRQSISKSEFRFYNLSHLPLIAQKTYEYSNKCNICKKNLTDLEEFAEMLPEVLEHPEGRKKFDKKKSQIETHLKSVHKIRFANYYYALYSIIGILIGACSGFVLSILIYRQLNFDMPLLFSVIGLILGQIFGKWEDKKRLKNNLTI